MTDASMIGIAPSARELINAAAELAADNVVVYIMPANVTPAPTSAAWSYTVPFELRGGTSGLVVPYNGTIGAAASDTSSAGTASVSSATPTVVNGRGTVTVSGNAAAWLNTETATLTLTYTKMRTGTATDTFVVTFTTA